MLVDSETHQWILIVEIKRTRSAVYSGRSQAQVKGYADANQQRFRAGWPVYFATTNLEATILCAVNGTRPASECVVSGGVVDSGAFDTYPAGEHRKQFVADLARLVDNAVKVSNPSFEVIWPPIVAEWLQHAESFASRSPAGPREPASASWDVVRDCYGQPPDNAAARLILLQALLAAFMRGRLKASNHSRAAVVPAVASRQQASRAIAALQEIDFDSIFDPGADRRYAHPARSNRSPLDEYVSALSRLSPNLSELAEERQDYVELIEEALLAIYPIDRQAAAGKIQTDPELANVLAALAIKRPGKVIDPCCGDGPLLVAGFDRLIDLGCTPSKAVAAVKGIEADPIAPRLAAARLALRATALLGSNAQPDVVQGDMFAASSDLQESDVVLMNPPFRRYEDQGESPIPDNLTAHYRNSIESPRGAPAETLVGQPNLFHYYVEFVARHIRRGTRVGFILDNKWFNNRSGAALRSVIKRDFRLLALIEYPHWVFFTSWDIATSLLIAVREDSPPDDHRVRFVRSLRDPRGVDLGTLASALHGSAPWPNDWKAESVPQGQLDPEVGWKRHFASGLPVDFTSLGLAKLSTLFTRSRRGSLEKEGGGTQAFAFPFTRRRFGNRLERKGGRSFSTRVVRRLTDTENEKLRRAAQAIPEDFRGWGLKNSDNVDAFELDRSHVERDQTLEPPHLREHPELFQRKRRSAWTKEHKRAIKEIRQNPGASGYLGAVEKVLNLTSQVLNDSERFVDLREPYAGELIIPRKMRSSHRVHVNPFAFVTGQRQVRLSTNFVTYGRCLATDATLDRSSATRLIAAFLVSSFGQLQFEREGTNREGLLAIEKDEIDDLLVLDPRTISVMNRELILKEFAKLPFPVPNDVNAARQERAAMDRMFAEELSSKCQLSPSTLLQLIHDAVDEWLSAREP